MCYSKALRNPLSDNLQEWVGLQTAPPVVLDWIKNGVSFPFRSEPTPFHSLNKPFTAKQQEFVAQEIQRLVSAGYLLECTHEVDKPVCVSPISVVPKKNKKLRLITDLRGLNDFVDAPHFQYESIDSVLDIVEPGDSLVTIDIKDGFFHVPINVDYQKYLGIEFNGKVYKYTVLPFGLCVSPYFFCKTVRPIIKFLRSIGVKVCVYVDDFIIAAVPSVIQKHRDIVLDVLRRLGFRVNFEKSSLEPSASCDFIGYVITTDNPDGNVWIEIPRARVTRLRHDIRLLLNRKLVTARALARVAGQCIAMAKVVLPGKLLLRNLYRLLRTRSSWNDKLYLDVGTVSDLRWWYEALLSWNRRAAPRRVIQAQVVTDASLIGWGGVLTQTKLEARGLWTPCVSEMPSNCREMLAILMTLISFHDHLQGKVVQILTDNVSAVAYINCRGGSSPMLTSIAKAIWQETLSNRMDIIAKHLAGKENVQADGLSRAVSQHDWVLNPALFKYLDRIQWTDVPRCATGNYRPTTACFTSQRHRVWIVSPSRTGQLTTTL